MHEQIPGLDLASPGVQAASFMNIFEEFIFPTSGQSLKFRTLRDFQNVQLLSKKDHVSLHKAMDPTKNTLVTLVKNNDTHDGDEDLSHLLSEISILRTLNTEGHHNILRFFDIIRGPEYNSVYFLFEHCEWLLSDLIKVKTSALYLVQRVKNIMQQLFTALGYLHKHSIMHGDLSPESISFQSDGLLKVSNFRRARRLGQKNNANYLSSFCYQPLEVLLGSEESATSHDIWSAACIFAELLLKKQLFQGAEKENVLLNIFSILGVPTRIIWKEFFELPYWDHIRVTGSHSYNCLGLHFRKHNSIQSMNSMELLQWGLIYNPMNRCTAEEFLHHEYFMEDPKACNNYDIVEMLASFRTESDIDCRLRAIRMNSDMRRPENMQL